jgi:putative endonuclease
MNRKWFVYIVACADNSLYTGISPDVEERVKKHNSKKGAKSLLGKLPVHLVYKQEIGSQTDAMRREREIKGWNRKKKLELVETDRL